MSLTRPYLQRYWASFAAALAFLAVESVCDLMQPTIMARIVDTGVAARDPAIVLRLGVVMLGVAGIGAIAATGRNLVASLVSFRFAAQLRAQVFSQITGFSFGELNRFDTASLVTRQTNDITQVQGFVNGIMRIFAKAPILAVGSLVMSVLLEPRLALILAVVVPVAGGLIAANLAVGFPRFRQVQQALDRVNSVTREYLGGIRVVKAFVQEDREVRRFAAANTELTDATRRALQTMAVFGPIIALTVNLGVVAVLWVGGHGAEGDGVRVGRVIALVNYMSQLLFALMMIANVFTVFVRARASWERLAEVLAAPASESHLTRTGAPGPGAPTAAPSGSAASAQPSPSARTPRIGAATPAVPVSPVAGAPPGAFSPAVPPPTPTVAEPHAGHLARGTGAAAAGPGTAVEFCHVSFAYPTAPGRRVLSGIELTCQPGRLTAVIGPTGSGKSTLAALVPRFYEPDEGQVRLGGVPVRELELAQLRRRIALVPQQTVLFSGPVAANLRWGLDGATDEELEAAARIACAHDFASALPEGYATRLGQGGVNLSGGQRQRLALARALIRRPEVLILDDCTSSVDSLTEAEILAGVRRWAAHGTCILITQRISAAAAADQVLVLDDGVPAGLGSHAELLRACDVYRDICAAQLGREALEGAADHA